MPQGHGWSADTEIYKKYLKGDQEFAGFWVRVVGYGLDLLIIFGLLVVLILIFPEMGYWSDVAYQIIWWSLVVVYHTTSLVLWSTTLGKKMCGLKVIDANDGGPVNLGQALGRSVSYILSSFLFGLGYLNVGFDKHLHRGLHDHLAKTLVIRETKHQLVGAIAALILGTLLFAALVALGSLDESYESEVDVGSTYIDNVITEAPPVNLTDYDYQDGYDTGYADGVSQVADFRDNYAPPVSQPRLERYDAGYIDGFLEGCLVGGFDCSEIATQFGR